jgi:hypothetical protein
LSEVEALIPTVIVRVRDDAGADFLSPRVTVDGQTWTMGRPEPIDPGVHVVAAEGPAGDRREAKFLVVDGERSRVVALEIPRVPATVPAGPATREPERMSTGIPMGAWIVGGAGVAALGTSLYFAALTSGDLDTLRRTCAPGCTPDQTQTGRTHALLTDLFLGVGSAAVAGAVVWALVSRSDGPPQAGSPWARWLVVGALPGGGVVGVNARY